MKVTPIPVTLTLPAPKVRRSKGVHQSSIIRELAIHAGKLEGDPGWEDFSLNQDREITDPLAITRMSVGLAWEEYYLTHLRGVQKHAGEVYHEGVFMSPDGIEWARSAPVYGGDGGLRAIKPSGSKFRVHECKATWKSINTVSAVKDDVTTIKDWMWVTQLMGYCKGLKTNLGALHVLFLNGDYKYPLRPQVLRWDFEFTQEELDERWDLIKHYKNFKESE